jgi:hypothetical protein
VGIAAAISKTGASLASTNRRIASRLNFSVSCTLMFNLQHACPFTLILYWNQLPSSGSSCIGQEWSLAEKAIPGILKIRQASGWCVFCTPDGRPGGQAHLERSFNDAGRRPIPAARYQKNLE